MWHPKDPSAILYRITSISTAGRNASKRPAFFNSRNRLLSTRRPLPSAQRPPSSRMVPETTPSSHGSFHRASRKGTSRLLAVLGDWHSRGTKTVDFTAKLCSAKIPQQVSERVAPCHQFVIQEEGPESSQSRFQMSILGILQEAEKGAAIISRLSVSILQNFFFEFLELCRISELLQTFCDLILFLFVSCDNIWLCDKIFNQNFIQ